MTCKPNYPEQLLVDSLVLTQPFQYELQRFLQAYLLFIAPLPESRVSFS